MYKRIFNLYFIKATLNEIKEERTIPKRPYLTDQDMLPEMKKLIEDCWSENPAMRPTIGLVRKTCIALKRFASDFH